ncbi:MULTISPECIES: superoxide dismutase[Cu-Zn] [unclassified Rhodococcus (in: high G+C Gram-positive bacteria)]|uniref:superoxide dismutase[Cu-Zn] n=1 Tax=unclassified Rhodococcus (in: high G+C Gram-positive bacteria) TaxID=192944 RepID=UPI00158255D0|nr:superoxide dismutase family protein [Rhodococcus sp. W8901]QKT13050.1 superoxide dismutase family protein [Rhodococcus sp. W8901]
MASHSTRRKSWRVVTPLVAIAALGLTACSNNEEPTDVPGTTPPVWTGSAAPSGSHAESGSENTSGPAVSDTVSVQLKDAKGTSVGTATLAETAGYVEITVDAQGLEPGFHGLHVHSVGKCEPNSVAPTGGEPGNFLSAGGHFQVEGHTGHPASGDLTSLEVREDGKGYLVTTTNAFTLADLKNGGKGTALMIHAGADNFANIPTRYTLPDNAPVPDQATLATGDAGGRVACGVIGG